MGRFYKVLPVVLLILATTFDTDSPPPGWYQQTLPRSDVIVQDIYFLDSLKGWAAARKYPSNDSAFIFATTDGGNNWITQFRDYIYLTSIQFTDANTGYTVGSAPPGIVKKTINGGQNWYTVSTLGAYPIQDLNFINRDTGWICSDDSFGGGVFKTINGGTSWTQQLNNTYRPRKLFFINNDTGWTSSSDWKLYKTTNSGMTWGLQHTFTNPGILSIYFINKDTGWITGGGGVSKTIDGGDNWTIISSNGGGFTMQFLNQSVAFGGNIDNMINKTTNGGYNWFIQVSPVYDNSSIAFCDTLRGWAGGSGVVHTTDGGGPPAGIVKSNTTVSSFKLKQNYPNPFNGITLIFFDLPKESRVDLKLYNTLGEEVSELLDDEYFTAGTVQFGFDSNKEELSSGVYFYRLTARPEDGKEIFIDTKKMILLK